MTNKILEAYIEYLEYPTIVVRFESLGFYSIDDFIEEGAWLKKENDAMDANRFSEEAFRREYLGRWDPGNDERSFEGTINFNTSLSAGVITSDRIATNSITDTYVLIDEITPSTATQFPIYDPSPFYFQPIEPPDTSCYRKYLNEIIGKELTNKFLLRTAKFCKRLTTFVNLKQRYFRHRIRDPTHRLIDHS